MSFFGNFCFENSAPSGAGFTFDGDLFGGERSALDIP
jgi:hypothetical protein